MEFLSAFHDKIELIDRELRRLLQDREDVPPLISEAMRYSVFAGGKRLRPVLALAGFGLFEAEEAAALHYACALEMIHTYSLIHDDLPAMDDSPLRRGRKTSHVIYGEAIAVLAGDALLNRAFEVMLMPQPALGDARVRAAAAYAARHSGVCGMIGGQVIDVTSENKQLSQAELTVLEKKKTAALIRAAVAGAAVLAGAPDEAVAALEAYADALGLAFQIQDDILDVRGDSEKLGKPTGADAAAGKNTFVSLLGLSQAEALLHTYTQQAQDSLQVFGGRAAFLQELTRSLLGREY